MALYGFAVCQAGTKWKFHSPTHQCNKYQPAPPEVTQARAIWLKRLF